VRIELDDLAGIAAVEGHRVGGISTGLLDALKDRRAR
jgi:hypothetical protein